jgi:hypothetical protein
MYFKNSDAGRTTKTKMSGQKVGKALWSGRFRIFSRKRPFMANNSGCHRLLFL